MLLSDGVGRAGLLGLVLLLVGLASSGTGVGLGGVNEAELQDLAVLARQKEITIQDAIRGYGWRNDISNLNHEVSKLYPNDFAHSRKNSGVAEIRFAGEVPHGAKEIYAAFSDSYPHARVNLIPNVGFTQQEKLAAVQAVHYGILGHKHVSNATTGFDIATLTIRSEAKLTDTASNSLIEDLESLAKTSMLSATRGDILETFSVIVVKSESKGTMDA